MSRGVVSGWGMAAGIRRSREELRAVLLDAGMSLLWKRGLEGGAEHVTFTEVFALAEQAWGSSINPASVYKRIWATQSDFQRDVLLAAAASYPDGEEGPTRTAALEVLERSDLRTEGSRASALSEICRVAGEAHIRALEASRPWQIWVGIWALTVSTPSTEDDEAIGPAIQKGHEKATKALEEFLGELLPLVGYRIADPFSCEQLALSIGALAEGLALRDRFASERVLRIDRPSARDSSAPVTGENGKTGVTSWTLFGVAVEGLVKQFCEPVPKKRIN